LKGQVQSLAYRFDKKNQAEAPTSPEIATATLQNQVIASSGLEETDKSNEITI
jgi:hypothetical protein